MVARVVLALELEREVARRDEAPDEAGRPVQRISYRQEVAESLSSSYCPLAHSSQSLADAEPAAA